MLPHPELLAARSRSALARLAAAGVLDDWYLAGSAALALHIGHRPVRDLDWMSPAQRLLPPARRDLLAALVAAEPTTEVETARDGYLFVRIGEPGDTVGVRFHSYPYPLVDPLAEHLGAAVAGRRDLGLMKLGAVISRGTRRDFLDLCLLCRTVPLEALLGAAEDKFGHVRDFAVQALKALADVDAADPDPLPATAGGLGWEVVRDWARQEARHHGRVLLAAAATDPAAGTAPHRED